MRYRLPAADMLLRFLAVVAGGGATGGILSFILLVCILPPRWGPDAALLGEGLALLVACGIGGSALAIPFYGVPAMYVLSASRIERAGAYALAGAAGGYLGLAFLYGGFLLASVAGALYGSSTGLWFWFVFRRRRGHPAEGA